MGRIGTSNLRLFGESGLVAMGREPFSKTDGVDEPTIEPLLMVQTRYEPFAGFEAWADLTVNEALWDRFNVRLRLRRTAAGPAVEELGLRRSLVAAALNTGAIEGLHRAGRGLTQTVIDHVLDWQPHVRAAEGPSAEAFVEAALDGFNMALDVATGHTPKLTEAWIRQVHATACAPQGTFDVVVNIGGEWRKQHHSLAHGSYKKVPNNVSLGDGSVHWYCPVADVGSEMSRLVDEIHSERFLNAHPILQTAFAHHAFASIHPFQDGNGRVSRVLGSVFLLRAASVPLLVYDDQQVEYFDALSAADRGDRRSFVRFIQERALDVVGLAAELPGEDDQLNDSLRIETPYERISSVLIEAAERLLDLVSTEFEAAIRRIKFGESIELSVSTLRLQGGHRDMAGRHTLNSPFPMARLEAKEFGRVLQRSVVTFVAEDPYDEYPLTVSVDGGSDTAEFRASDVHPILTTASRQLVHAFIGRVAREFAAEMQRLVDEH